MVFAAIKFQFEGHSGQCERASYLFRVPLAAGDMAEGGLDWRVKSDFSNGIHGKEGS